MTRQTTIRPLFADDSTASRCLGLIERHAARMMRTGGGGIAREAASQIHTYRITADKKARALELSTTGLYSATEIAAMVGSTQSTISKFLRKAGASLRDGRAPRKPTFSRKGAN
jgi:transposase-like protein